MFEVKVDSEKKRIYIVLSGFMQDFEVEEAMKEVKNAVNLLKPGFDIINDITDFKPVTAKGRELIKNTQAYIYESKVKNVMRIEGSVLSKIQLERSSKEVGYSGITVKSIEEAEQYLEDNK